MATCDLATLLRDGKCFCGATTNKKDIAELQLLCNILSAVGGGGTTVQDMQVAWTPTNLKLSQNVGLFTFGDFVDPITNLVIDCTVNNAGFDLESVTSLVSLTFPNLQHVDPTNTQGGYLFISGCSSLTTLTVPDLVTSQGRITVLGCNSLASLSFPSLTSVAGGGGTSINIINNTTLTSLSLPIFVPANGIQLVFSGNNLNAASVNGILAMCVAAAGFVTGGVTLNGGTNAAPSGQGIADKATLIGRGVAVATN